MNVIHGSARAIASRIGAMAAEALHAELALDPKPGLVTPTRQGSHADMDHASFIASIAALEPYFVDCAALGAAGAPFVDLRDRAILAEQDMLAATGGVNTHKGAIFTLGLLTAAAGSQVAKGPDGSTDDLGVIVGRRWGAALVDHGKPDRNPGPLTNGQRVRILHAVPGAREHAAAGFPTLFSVTLPALRWALSRTASPDVASLHALLTTMAILPDTNLVHRGGPEGLEWAQRASERFVAEGSVFVADWQDRLERLVQEFEKRWLSPGGSADLLGAAWFVHRYETVLAPDNARLAEACPA